MSATATVDLVHLWERTGIPDRLVWAGTRYRVITADPVTRPVDHDALTHPVDRLTGWAIVAAAEDDPTAVCALQLERTRAGWVVVDVDPA
jgi:hypothetical protein